MQVQLNNVAIWAMFFLSRGGTIGIWQQDSVNAVKLVVACFGVIYYLGRVGRVVAELACVLCTDVESVSNRVALEFQHCGICFIKVFCHNIILSCAQFTNNKRYVVFLLLTIVSFG